MRAVRERPIYSHSFNAFDLFHPDPGAVYVHAESVEERSRHSPIWEAGRPQVQFVRVAEQAGNAFTPSIGQSSELDLTKSVQVRSMRQLTDFWRSFGAGVAYIDITGLDHSTWAPLVVSAFLTGIDLRVVYVEPQEYAFSTNPTEGEIFDLSERVRGISPLPGLATLADSSVDSVFVPLLGFEGTRLAHVIEHVQPTGDQTVPVIGLPGYRLEYPFHTYLGNVVPLRETKSWHNAMYARANCPFSLWYVLQDIAHRWPAKMLRVALIGTKPHALGAVLYWMTSPDVVELVYDHPVRKDRRTTGISRTSVYYVSALIQANPAPRLHHMRARLDPRKRMGI